MHVTLHFCPVLGTDVAATPECSYPVPTWARSFFGLQSVQHWNALSNNDSRLVVVCVTHVLLSQVLLRQPQRYKYDLAQSGCNCTRVLLDCMLQHLTRRLHLGHSVEVA